MLTPLDEDLTWSIVIGVGMFAWVNFIYYWYLWQNGDKQM